MRKLKIQRKMEMEGMELDRTVVNKKRQKLTLLEAVNAILVLAEDSELSEDFFKEAKRYIKYMSDVMEITPIQSVLLSLFIETSASGSNSGLSDVARFLDCRNVRVLQYEPEVLELVKNGMLRQCKRSFDDSLQYAVPESVMEAVKKNEPFKRISYKGCEGVKFFQCFFDITHLRHEEELSTELMMDEVKRLFDENAELHYVKTLRALELDDEDRFCYTEWDFGN